MPTTPPPLFHRIQRRLRRDATTAGLAALRAFQGEAASRDYGWIRLPSSGDGDLQEVYYHLHCQAWYREEFARLVPHVRPGDTVVDVGSNLGFMTTVFHRLCAPDGRVVSFEPSGRSFRKLQRVIALNGLGRAEAIHAGCGAVTRTGTLHHAGPSSGTASLLPIADEPHGEGDEEVRLVRLDDFVAERDLRVHLLKIDTGGHEAAVLAGARGLLVRDHPAVYVDLSQEWAASSRQAVRLLRDLGYAPDREPDLSRAHTGDNFLFTHPDRGS